MFSIESGAEDKSVKQDTDEEIHNLMNQMSIEEKVGQLFIVHAYGQKHMKVKFG